MLRESNDILYTDKNLSKSNIIKGLYFLIIT